MKKRVGVHLVCYYPYYPCLCTFCPYISVMQFAECTEYATAERLLRGVGTKLHHGSHNDIEPSDTGMQLLAKHEYTWECLGHPYL